jgi:hypothetical protein
MWLAAFEGPAQAITPIAPQGETLVGATVGTMTVQVRIKVHEVQIGKPSDKRPDVIESNCTYSKYPCSVVDSLSVNVNEKSLFVPRSAFADLADLTKAEIKQDHNGAILVLYGGDTSESYVAKIEFDSTQVKQRTLVSAISPDEPLQETVYHATTLGD